MQRALLSLCLLAAVLVVGCDSQQDTLTDVEVSGTATDATDGVPVANMTIELREGITKCIGILGEQSCVFDSILLNTTATDQNGHYRVDYSHQCSETPDVQLYLVVDDSRCSSNQAQAIPCSGEAQVVNFFCIEVE